jgi:hypothetical protein
LHTLGQKLRECPADRFRPSAPAPTAFTWAHHLAEVW